MNKPNQQTVREIATEIILDCGRNADDVGAYVRIRVGDDLSKHEHEAWCGAIRSAIRTAVVTVEWPGEQQPADVVTAEQQQDEAAGRVEAIRARYDTHGFRALSDGQIDELFGFLLGHITYLERERKADTRDVRGLLMALIVLGSRWPAGLERRANRLRDRFADRIAALADDTNGSAE